MIDQKNKDRKESTILIVEEDLQWRKKIKDFLHIFGFRNVETANDGTTAWNKLSRFDIELVICNLQLTSMNGLALLKIMMSDEAHCNIPFLMTTNRAEKKDVMDAAKAGVSGFMVKPFNHEKLIDKINDIFDKIDPMQKVVKKLFEQGRKLINDGEYEKALKVFNKIIELTEEAEAYYQIGYIKESQGDMDEAAKAFRKAIQVNTTFVKAYEALGKAYKKMGKEKDSEKFYEKAGDLYLKKEMLEEAEEVYREANEMNPKNINIYNSLGIVYRRKGLYLEAIKEYKKALTVEPEDENIYYNLGRAYLESKDVKNAKESFEQALNINPEFNESELMLKAISIGFNK